MSDNNVQIKISKEDMERIKKSSNTESNDAKPKLSPGAMILRVVGCIIAVAYYAVLAFGRFFMDTEGEFYSSLNPFSGVENPNRIIRIVSLCILTLSISFVLRFIIKKMALSKGITKRTGVAVIELIGSTVKYVAYLVLVFLILNAVGVNTTELLAGFGILSLILGLGMTSLIEDIVAGIFIIVEHLFDVGDIIVLDGFRGTVVSIGMRSTKIADVGNDVLTVRNSSIGSLVNLTDRQSAAAITIPLAPQESIARVEMLVKQSDMSYMKEKYPKLIGDPLYLGICGITDRGVQNLLIVGGCKEENKYDIERALYLEYKLLFERNGIQLGYTGPEEYK